MLPLRLAGSGPPSPESTAELRKADAHCPGWQGGKGKKKQGSLRFPVAWRAKQQFLTQSHPGSKLPGSEHCRKERQWLFLLHNL